MIEIKQNHTLAMKINDVYFEVELEENQSVVQFLERLPYSFLMKELHGNEKYTYLEEPLFRDPTDVKTIQTGDLMLFQDDCLVLFYKDFTTDYQYTRIGRIKDIEKLKECVTTQDIEVEFKGENEEWK